MGSDGLCRTFCTQNVRSSARLMAPCSSLYLFKWRHVPLLFFKHFLSLRHLFRGASPPTRTTYPDNLPGQKFDRSIEHTIVPRRAPGPRCFASHSHLGRRYPERDRADGSL